MSGSWTPLEWLHAAGRPLGAQVHRAWTVRDDEVTRFRQYVDTAQRNAVMDA